MRTHERGLIDKLIHDPDRQTSEHDLACQYLATPTVRAKLFQAVVAPKIEGGRFRYTVKEFNHNAQLERPLIKGDGQYRTLVGFVDVLFRFDICLHGVHPVDVVKQGAGITHDEWSRLEPSVRQKHVACRECGYHPLFFGKEHYHPFEYTKGETVSNDINHYVVAEVKIKPCSTSDLLRQMALYREFSGLLFMNGYYDPERISLVVATRFKISQGDANVLHNEGLKHIYLGDGFTQWLKQRETENQIAVAPEM